MRVLLGFLAMCLLWSLGCNKKTGNKKTPPAAIDTGTLMLKKLKPWKLSVKIPAKMAHNAIGKRSFEFVFKGVPTITIAKVKRAGQPAGRWGGRRDNNYAYTFSPGGRIAYRCTATAIGPYLALLDSVCKSMSLPDRPRINVTCYVAEKQDLMTAATAAESHKSAFLECYKDLLKINNTLLTSQFSVSIINAKGKKRTVTHKIQPKIADKNVLSCFKKKMAKFAAESTFDGSKGPSKAMCAFRFRRF